MSMVSKDHSAYSVVEAVFVRMVYENTFVRSAEDHKFVNMGSKNTNVENVLSQVGQKNRNDS